MTMDFTDINSVDKRRKEKAFSLDVAEVVSVPDNADHTISIRRLGDDGGVIGAPALVPSKGDVGLPQPGDLVIIGFAIGGQRIVLGTLYEDDAPDYRSGVRRIGHPRTNSNITITRDGDIELNPVGSLYVNGDELTGDGAGDVELHGSEAHEEEYAPDPHDNNAHSEIYAVDGDQQPPETHDNTAHSETYALQTTLDGHILDTANPHDTTLEEARTQNNVVDGDIVQEYSPDGRVLSTMQYDQPHASPLPAGETAASLMTDNAWDDNIHAHSDNSGQLTYEQAQDWARERGGRLPTLEEVEGLVTKGSGSGYDSDIIWTQTKAGPNSHYVQYGSYTTATGADPNNPAATREARDDTQTAVVRWVAEADQSHLYGGRDVIFKASDTNTNINSSGTASWNNTDISDSAYSFNGTTVTIQEAGTYEISAEVDYTSSVARVNPNIGIQVNNNWAGAIARHGYIRAASGHNASSLQAHTIEELSVGDTVHVETLQEAASDTIVPERSQFTIKKLIR